MTIMKEVRKIASLADSLSPSIEGVLTSAADRSLLVERARHLIRIRTQLEAFIPQGLIKDWAWDMLLELFIHAEEGNLVYVKQLILASGVSATAAMRLIDRLEEAELIRRLADPLDSRRVIVTLSDRGWDAMVVLLRSLFEPRGTGR